MTSGRTLLVVDDDPLIARAIHDRLSSDVLEVIAAHDAASGLDACEKRSVDVVVLDQRLPDGDGHALCGRIHELHPAAKIVFVTAYPSFDHAVQALKAGAYDYLCKPFELEALAVSVRRCCDSLDLERAERREAYRKAKDGEESVLVGRGDAMERVRAALRLAAGSDAPVLVTGETGTGKNLVAKAIHFGGPRSAGPFIALNCAALPEHLVEAELLGWDRGAFTGAVASREGVVEMADGGTLFLDEIGEMPVQLQTKLLSILEDREVRRLGGRSARKIDLRVVAATNADLEERVAGGRFRPDLFYRLDVVRMRLPPLRERPGDVPELCRHLLRKLAGARRDVSIAAEELERLQAYRWPGNVRELRNILERSLVLHRDRLRPSELLAAVGRVAPPTSPREPALEGTFSLEAVERRHIEAALLREEGNLARTARALGIALTTLKRKLKQYSGDARAK